MTSEAKSEHMPIIETIAMSQIEAESVPSETSDATAEGHETHEHPRGALVITIFYLLLLVVLWVNVYLQLLSSGGIPQP